jgi:RNA polymerase sigma-70 factor (ECF subfamily)
LATGNSHGAAGGGRATGGALAPQGSVAPVVQAPRAEETGPLPADPREALAMHGPWLRAVAIARLRGLEGADDVMQDVAMAAIRNWETLRTAANAKPWLYRLTVRAALMHRRTLGRARKRIKEAMDTYTARHGLTEAPPRRPETGAGDVVKDGDPLGSLLSSERHTQLRVAIAKLPVKDVEMLLLKHVDDCSYQEIARRLGVTAGVVQMRLFRARQKLREILLQQYPE